jgi:acetylornithine deacetylase/succinyl-diaminopimelate desuccinylase-like protein
MYNLLRAKTSGLAEEIVSFAQTLIRTPSLSLQEEAAAEITERHLLRIGYDKVFRDDFGNVVAILFGREATPVVLLNSHLDTVSGDIEDSWRESPTGGTIADGKLLGLGAADCKGGLAAQAYVGLLLKRSLLPLRGTLIFTATTAEENGRSVGMRGLMEKTLPELGLRPDYVVLGEPTNLGLYYGHDGWVDVDIRVEGQNQRMVDDAAQAVLRGLRAEATPVAEAPCLQTVSEPRFENVGGLRRAVVGFGRRLETSEDAGRVVGRIRNEAALAVKTVGAAVAVQAEVREETQRLYTGRTTIVRSVVNAWATDPFHPLLERSRQCLFAAGCQVRPARWRLGLLGMGTAGSVLTHEYHLPVVGYGPGDEEAAHRPNEAVETAKIVETTYGTTAIVHGLIGVPVVGWTTDEI